MEMDVADKMSERICLEQLQRGRETRLVCEVKPSNNIPVIMTPMTFLATLSFLPSLQLGIFLIGFVIYPIAY